MTLTERLPADEIAEDQLRIDIGHATDAGGRANNEDAVYVGDFPAGGNGDPEGSLMAVADGMGGHDGGEVASRIAIDTLQEMLAAGSSSDAETAQLLKRAFRRANDQIFQQRQGQGQGQDDEAGMGTTLVAAATRGKYATIANVGDSRAYLIRANHVTQITKDHSLVADEVAQGSLSADQARKSPRRNILTHALGQREKLDSKLPGIFEITLLPEDCLLLCTDGFYDVASDDDLMRVALGAEPEAAVGELVALAKERGTTDNVTAVVASVQAAKVREPVLVDTDRGRPSALAPVFVASAAVVIIAIIAAVYLFVL